MNNNIYNEKQNLSNNETSPIFINAVKSEINSGVNIEKNEIVNLVYNATQILSGHYKQSRYIEIILPFVVLRRLEKVLETTKNQVLEEYEKMRGIDDKLIEERLNSITQKPFHNISKYGLEILLTDPYNIHRNIKAYLRGFSEQIRDIFDNFDFDHTVDNLHRQKILYPIVQYFAQIPLDTVLIDNHTMGIIYEELIRRLTESEDIKNYFIPKEVIILIVKLLFSPNKDLILQKHSIRRIYDPAPGIGTMLSLASDYFYSLCPDVKVETYGQVINDEAYAICKSHMLLKGFDLNNIKRGNSLTSEDHFKDRKFDYMLSNPPYGKDWRYFAREIEEEHERKNGRYDVGLPRKSDGSLLFLQHMISKMHAKDSNKVSRIAIVLNGSPLFAGEAGSGESEIRKWIIENDMLETIIALPNNLFYNTGINTYIWILTNKKEDQRKGKVQLINAKSIFEEMQSHAEYNKNVISDNQIEKILNIYNDFQDDEYSKIINNNDFGYRMITIEQPLKRNFQFSIERLERLKQDSTFKKLKDSTKKEIIDILKTIDPLRVFTDSEEFLAVLEETFKKADFKLTKKLELTIEDALSERDDNAKPILSKTGNKIPDPYLKKYENIPLNVNIESYFEKEIKPYMKDAWINDSSKNNIGYEIPFDKYFYNFKPLIPVSEVESEILNLEKEISEELRGLLER
jgi:type I restriction enzyme M protein